MRATSLLWSVVFSVLLTALRTNAATFPGNARVEINDPSGALTVSNNQYTVSCWFKIVIPSNTNLTENMTVLVNRETAGKYAYVIRYNVTNGNLEFATTGDSSSFTGTLIQSPYLERWYHVAVTRQNNEYRGFVDGRKVFDTTTTVGNSASSNGVAIAGWPGQGSGQYFFGEIQEVAIYQTALSEANVFSYMFQDQTLKTGIRGYYRLGYSTNSTDLYRNFVPSPPTSTNPGTPTGSGQITFEDTDRAGEQSTFDARKNGGEYAITPLSGAFSWEQTVLARPTPGIAFDFRIGYSTALTSPGSEIGTIDPYADPNLGVGWRHTFETRVLPDPNSVFSELRVIQWDGNIETWVLTNGIYKTRSKEYRGELVQQSSGIFEWTNTPERLIYRFRPLADGPSLGGRLFQIQDSNSNLVQVLWDDNSQAITQVVDTAGDTYDFHYTGTLLTNVSFQGWNVWFNYDGQNRLTNKFITAPTAYSNLNTRWSFTYDATSGLLNGIVDPLGNTNAFALYDKYGRMTNRVDAIGRATKTEYDVPAARQIRHTDPGGYQWIETYDRKGRVLSQADPLGNTTSYTYDDNGNRTTITEPLGWKTTFSYDSRANVLSKTNALGQVTKWTYHSFFNKPLTETDPLGNTTTYTYNDTTGNLLTQLDSIGTLVSYTYTTNGLVQTATDANGNVTTFSYNSDGFLASKTDPATNTTSYSRNEVGWVLSETNALAQVTAYSYDINGNVIQIVDPLFRTFTKTYDPNGNLTAQSDAKAQFTRYGYDAANQRTNMVDRTGTNTWTYTYTTRGEPEKIIDPLGNVVSNAYDNPNRLVAVFDPLNNVSSNVYDNNGNKVAFIDKLGQRWTKVYDRLNRVIAESDPYGDTKQTVYDAAGRIKTITPPNGYPSTHDYDPRGRLTKWVDAEGFNWLYSYDGNGNIVDIQDALHGHYVMAYGPRNERILEKNQDNFQWTYHYDKLLRPDQQTDPNSTVRSIVYDNGGRIDYVSFSTGRVDDYQYDDNNNLTLLSRSTPGDAPTSSTFTFDVLDRVTQYTDAFSKSVKYGYDQLGRVNALTYPDNKILTQRYDALSRLTNQVDWANRRIDYAYDKANRLTWRRYPNGAVQTNAFDNASRLTSLSYGSAVSSFQSGGIPSNGLVLYWKFDAGDGTDSSGNGRTATVVGASQANGMNGAALYFNGSLTDYVVLNPFSAFPNQELSIAFWVRTTRTSEQYPLSFFTTEDAFRLDLNSSGIRIDVDNATPGAQTSVSVADGAWHHLVVTWRRSDGATQVYKDGSLSWSGTYATGASIGSTGSFVLGQEQNSSGGGFNLSFTGSLDDVLVYSRVIASDEVQRVYRGMVDAQIALTYAYDRNGNKVGSTEQGTFDWPQPSRHDETAGYTASGRLQTKTDTAQTNNNWTYAFDASGNMTNAIGAGQSIAFTYDEDNRVLTLGWEAGITSKNIQNRYDALGRRISRKQDGVETRYALGLQGDMERILCDMNASGQITAYYIHGPDLCYKVTPGPTETITCYHADAQANIIALTDSNAATVAQYAYTPYGRSIGSTNFQSQVTNSYLFVGSQGVMEDPPGSGLYFMRARYYSTDTGTFLSTDPIKHIGPGWKPVSYAYAEGDPLSFMDATGLYFETVDFKGTVGYLGVGSYSVRLGKEYDSFVDKLLDRSHPFYSKSEELGVGDYAGASGSVVPGAYGGTPEDWENYTRVTASLDIGVGFSVSFARSSTGKLGFSIGVGEGVGGGIFVSKPAKSVVNSAMNMLERTTVDTKVADNVNYENTINAANYAESKNTSQANGPVTTGNHSGTTTVSSNTGSGGSGGNTAFAKTVQTVKQTVSTVANNVSTVVKSVTSTVKQAVSSAVSAVKSFVSNLFGGGKKK